uniref:Inositol-pentakisphosphate 2-kinase n=1 Tax=Chenopodium quinoa TaxID=63459 RepID=A0A803LVE9_CHEQI
MDRGCGDGFMGAVVGVVVAVVFSWSDMFVSSQVDRLAKPPVCKIMDYNRERYKKQVREKERAKIKIDNRLLEVQKLDKFDVEGAIHAYYDIVSQPCKICKDSGEERQLGKYNSLHSIPVDESLKIIRDYLIAATAKNCSLMISFHPREDDDQESHYRTI